MAYRVGGKARDPHTGRPINFTNKKGVIYSEVLVPFGATVPGWAREPYQIALQVQRWENRVNSRYYKEQEISLPICLGMEQRIGLARKFTQEQDADARGLLCILSIHRYGARKERFKRDETRRMTEQANEDTAQLVEQWKEEGLPFLEEADAEHCDTAHVMVERNGKGAIVGWRAFQPHAHILMPMRRILEHGFAAHKDRGLDHKPVLKAWRTAWDEYANSALEAAGRPERIDHRTLEAQKEAPRQGGRPVHPSQIAIPGHDIAAEYIDPVRGHYRQQRSRTEDVRSYNSSLDFGPLIMQLVGGYAEGGLIGMAEAAVGGLVSTGLLAGAGHAVASVPRAVVDWVEGRHGPAA